MRKTFLFLLILLLVLPLNQANASIYQISFHYDKSTGFLSFDTSKGSPVQIDQNQDMSPVEFYQMTSEGPFTIVFTSYSGDEIVKKQFNPDTDPFVLDTPYYGFAKSFEVFRDNVPTPILTQELSQLSTCNQNGICEYEKGETLDTCLSDCTGTSVQFSLDTKNTLQQNNGIIRDPRTGDILLNDVKVTPVTSEASQNQEEETKQGGLSIMTIFSLIVAAIVIVGGIVFLWKHREYR